jgi:hypothetical protein
LGMQKREGRLHLQEKDLACGADRDVGGGGWEQASGGRACSSGRSGREAGRAEAEQKQSRSRAEAEQKPKQKPKPGREARIATAMQRGSNAGRESDADGFGECRVGRIKWYTWYYRDKRGQRAEDVLRQS